MEKTALIIIDDADSTRKLADTIAEALSALKTIVVPAEKFDVTQLLAAAVCFLGAENPNPPSFSELCTVLAHINLAGRPCGAFSVSKEAGDYLCEIVKDSEAVICPNVFSGNEDAKIWTEKVITKG